MLVISVIREVIDWCTLHVREWFHNNTWVLSGPAILKIKGKPKMVQDWQAYHALTYEKQCKPYIDNQWETYKQEWEAGNTTQNKPPKSRLSKIGGLNHAPLIPAGFRSFLRNPEESILAQSPAKITFRGTNIPVEWCHSWLGARMVPGMDKKECIWNAETGIDINNNKC